MNLLLDDDNDERESWRINPTRKPGESVTELEHHSWASDTTTEEDLAFCLIMLSRYKLKQHKKIKIKQTFEEDETEHECCEDYKSSKNRGRFKCGEVLISYQALGGHRESHKKKKIFTTKNRASENRVR